MIPTLAERLPWRASPAHSSWAIPAAAAWRWTRWRALPSVKVSCCARRDWWALPKGCAHQPVISRRRRFGTFADRAIAAAHAAVGEQAFEGERAAGRAMSLEETVAFAPEW